MTLSLPLRISGHITLGWDGCGMRPGLCPRGVLGGGTDASTVLCMWLSSQRQRSQFIPTLPPPTPDGAEPAQGQRRRSHPLPRPLSQALVCSGGFAGSFFFFCLRPQRADRSFWLHLLRLPQHWRAWEKRNKDRGLERWVMCSWLVLSPPPPRASQDLRVWMREEDPTGEPLWLPPPLAGGGEAQRGGLRSQPQ